MTSTADAVLLMRAVALFEDARAKGMAHAYAPLIFCPCGNGHLNFWSERYLGRTAYHVKCSNQNCGVRWDDWGTR